MSDRLLSLAHLVHTPAREHGPPPLLILLHGYGSNEHDLFELTPYLDPRLLILSVRAPFVLMPQAYAWFAIAFTPQGILADPLEAERSRNMLVTFIEEAIASYAVDPARVFLVGFSQGATMAALAGLTRPDLVAGTAILSGLVPTQVQEAFASPEQLEGRSFFVGHGANDTVVPVAQGRASRELLGGLPVALEYHEYQMAHEINAECLRDLSNWLVKRIES